MPKQDPQNFRFHGERNKELINKSLSKFSAGRSILLDNDEFTIAGNGVLEQAEELGIPIRIIETDGSELIAVKRTDIGPDDPKRKELALADNATTDSSDWDVTMLLEHWTTEELEEWDVELPDFEQEIEPAEDSGPGELPVHPKTVLGDLYELHSIEKGLVHRVLCGDSTDSDAVGKLMNGETSEILFTSPPYSDMRDYEGGKDLSVSNLIDFIPTFLPYTNFQVVNLGLQRKDNEIVQYWDEYIDKAKECGYMFLSWNIWDRTASGTMAQQTAMFGITHEWIFVFGKYAKKLNRTVPNKHDHAGEVLEKKVRQSDGTHEKTTSKFYSHKQLNTVFTHLYETGNIRSEHPATFPIGLPSAYIEAMTSIKDIVAESFTGSGTTLIACEQLSRHCYGMELDEKYSDVIVKRWVKYMTENDKPFTVKRNGEDITDEEWLMSKTTD